MLCWVGSRGVLENGAVVKTIVAIVEIFEKFHVLDPERFHDIGAFLATGKDVRVSIQSKFTQYLADARLENFMARWFTVVRGTQVCLMRMGAVG